MKTNINKKIVPNDSGNYFGFTNYLYESNKGTISLITPSIISMELYEIYCIKGELLEDIERFDTLDEAEERINQLL